MAINCISHEHKTKKNVQYLYQQYYMDNELIDYIFSLFCLHANILFQHFQNSIRFNGSLFGNRRQRCRM